MCGALRLIGGRIKWVYPDHPAQHIFFATVQPPQSNCNFFGDERSLVDTSPYLRVNLPGHVAMSTVDS